MVYYAGSYWQVEMNENDKEKTAFCMLCGLFEFNVLPFGLANAPAAFQRLMELLLARLQWKICLVYIHDVIITGRNQFLGHIVSREGVQPDPRKVEKVMSWSEPITRKEVQQFLGLANYYRCCVPNFATIAITLPRHRYYPSQIF